MKTRFNGRASVSPTATINVDIVESNQLQTFSLVQFNNLLAKCAEKNEPNNTWRCKKTNKLYLDAWQMQIITELCSNV